MPQHGESPPDVATNIATSSVAKYVGICGGLCCAAICLWIALDTFAPALLHGGDNTGKAMGQGLDFFVFMPWAFIPTIVTCLAGMLLSKRALVKNPADAGAELGWTLSFYGPVITVIAWAIGFRIITAMD